MPTSTKNLRNIQDAALQAVIALPAAGATAVTSGIDLGQVTGGEIEGIGVVVEVPATPSLVDAKVITITLKDSANGTDFTAIPNLAVPTITGIATGAGGSALEFRVRLPQATRQYIRAEAAIPGDGGSNIAKSMTLSVLV